MMTVAELIAKLQTVDPTRVIYVEDHEHSTDHDVDVYVGTEDRWNPKVGTYGPIPTLLITRYPHDDMVRL